MTKHAIDRTNERANLKVQSATKLMDRALRYGKTPASFPAKERRYLEHRLRGNQQILCYSDYCFIFSEDGKCITMYMLPKWFGEKNNFQGKEVIRNKHKYAKMNPEKFFGEYDYELELCC